MKIDTFFVSSPPALSEGEGAEEWFFILQISDQPVTHFTGFVGFASFGY